MFSRALQPSLSPSSMQGEPGSSSEASLWDPMREVQQMVGTVQGQHGEKLVLLEPIGKGGFGTVYRGRLSLIHISEPTRPY